MVDRTVAAVGFRVGTEFGGGHDARVKSRVAERVLQSDGVDRGREHPHRVGADGIHILPLSAAPDVAGSDDHPDLGAEIQAPAHHVGKRR